MFNDFDKMRRNPFENTPDPSFMFLTKQYMEALSALYYGVQWRKGFVVLTGEVGVGKTVLIRYLLRLLQGNDIDCAYAYVFNSRLSALEFLQYVSADLGLASWNKNKAELLHDLSKYLISRYQKKLTTFVVVDDAHHMATEVLEEVRFLTNLETSEQKLLQILLVGQPELATKLDSFELRQLKQRITLRAYIEPLNLEETKGYIRHRLQVAGIRGDDNLISDETIATVYRYSGGVARVINIIVGNALVATHARQLTAVPPEIIVKMADDLRIEAVAEPETQPRSGMARELNHVLSASLLDEMQAMRERNSDSDRGLQEQPYPFRKPPIDA